MGNIKIYTHILKGRQMKKPSQKNEQKSMGQKPVVPKNKKPTKEKSVAPKTIKSKEGVKKSIIQKIEEKMAVKSVSADLSKVVDKVLIVFIVLQVLGLIYLLAK